MSTPSARALAIAVYQAGDAAAGQRVLARVAGPDGAAARVLLAAMHGPDGAALVTRVRRELAAARPTHWRSVHRTWLDELLAGEGAVVRAAVLGDGDAPHERQLARAFLGRLAPMPDPAAPARGVHALLAIDPEVLARAVVVIGRRQIAHAFIATPRDELAQLAARLAWGKELVAEVAALGSLGAATEARLGSRQAAFARMKGIDVGAPTGPVRVGLRALAPQVTRVPPLAEQLAQRLSRPLGQLAQIDLGFVVASTGALDGVSDEEIGHAIARASVGAS